MKKVAIGVSFLVCGVLTDLMLVFMAITYLPHLNAWSTAYLSKLMFLIFAGNSQFGDGANGLGLGVFFLFGVALALLGIFILLKEYFFKQST